MTIFYKVNNSLYVNLTNRCPCACTFCLRHNGDGVGGSDSLWLAREPTMEEVLLECDKHDINDYDELVFCGYGEPTERLDDLLALCEHIKKSSDTAIRINTNGLADLICNKPTAHRLKGFINTVSISLNAPNAEEFLKITRSKFGEKSFDAMLKYARDCKEFVPHVVMTVVDVVTSPEEQAQCKKICDDIGVSLRIRPFEKV